MERRRMCPNCRAFISRDDRVCQYCGVSLSKSSSPAVSGDLLAGLIPEHAFTTFVLLLINGVVWTASIIISRQAGHGDALMSIDGQTLVLLGAKFTPYIRNAGQWWRLVTAGFLHGGALHILMNSWAMFDLGRQVDVVYGSARYLVFYFIGTITGFWFSVMFSPQSLSVGASAGLFGLLGAMIAVGFLSNSAMAREIRSSYMRFAGYSLLFGVLTMFGGPLRIDNMAHIGGLVGGFGAAMIAGLPRPVIPMKERMWKLAAWICVLITILSFVRMVQFFELMNRTPMIAPRPAVTRELPSERL
jgi:rhomboid protease GluP